MKTNKISFISPNILNAALFGIVVTTLAAIVDLTNTTFEHGLLAGLGIVCIGVCAVALYDTFCN